MNDNTIDMNALARVHGRMLDYQVANDIPPLSDWLKPEQPGLYRLYRAVQKLGEPSAESPQRLVEATLDMTQSDAISAMQHASTTLYMGNHFVRPNNLALSDRVRDFARALEEALKAEHIELKPEKASDMRRIKESVGVTRHRISEKNRTLLNLGEQGAQVSAPKGRG